MKFNYLKLNKIKILTIIGIWIISVILHNLISQIFGIEEAFFFIIAVIIIPIYFIISLIYTIFKKIR